MNDDLIKAKEALVKANIPIHNITWYFTGTDEEYEEFIRSFDPKERTMTYEQATADLAVTPVEVAEVAIKFDAEGNPVAVTEEVGFVTDEGDVATPADVTVH